MWESLDGHGLESVICRDILEDLGWRQRRTILVDEGWISASRRIEKRRHTSSYPISQIRGVW